MGSKLGKSQGSDDDEEVCFFTSMNYPSHNIFQLEIKIVKAIQKSSFILIPLSHISSLITNFEMYLCWFGV